MSRDSVSSIKPSDSYLTDAGKLQDAEMRKSIIRTWIKSKFPGMNRKPIASDRYSVVLAIKANGNGGPFIECLRYAGVLSVVAEMDIGETTYQLIKIPCPHVTGTTGEQRHNWAMNNADRMRTLGYTLATVVWEKK